MKRANKGTGVPAESVERRASMERNSSAERKAETQSSVQSQQGLERVRAAARESRTERFTNLMHHISESMLGEAYEALNRKAAPGDDGISWSR
jgi:RNA-directed DNA polymerase